jgi:DNA helicase-2/ATP-dependent DNA helicase PcrA
MTSPRHTATIASAGSGKTGEIVERALLAAAEGGRVLVTTYTNENHNELERRIAEAAGSVPAAIEIRTWYSFVISELCRPYQSSCLGRVNHVGSMAGFDVRPHPRARKTSATYYMTKPGDLFSDRVTAFALMCQEASDGAVLERLEQIYSHIFIDEMQDLAGHDFDLLVLLFNSRIVLHLVGDPRQSLFFTDRGNKNRKFKGAEFVAFLKAQENLCEATSMAQSHRCHQAILDWADKLFPEYQESRSLRTDSTGHDGVFFLSRDEVAAYVETYDPVVLRQEIRTPTEGLQAINFGVSKGSTHPRVLIFGSKPMAQYARGEIGHADLTATARSKLYVAVTRAQYSAAIVV